MKLRILPEAEREMVAAAQWYEDAQSGLGEKFLAATIDALFEIEKHPKRFARIREEIKGYHVRHRHIGRFSYAVVYEIQARESVVIAIAHLSRRPGYWHDRLG